MLFFPLEWRLFNLWFFIENYLHHQHMAQTHLCSFLQFGMLIEFLFEKFPNSEDVSETAIGDLQVSTI